MTRRDSSPKIAFAPRGRVPPQRGSRLSPQLCAKNGALPKPLVSRRSSNRRRLPLRASLRGPRTLPFAARSAALLTDSEWTRRDSNPGHRKSSSALIRFDTHRTPAKDFRFPPYAVRLLAESGTIAKQKSKIVWQVVVPPILLISVICLGAKHRRRVRTLLQAHSSRCGRIASGTAPDTRQNQMRAAPHGDPPALLSVGHSPSRCHH